MEEGAGQRGKNQSPVKTVWLHICPFHSAVAEAGLAVDADFTSAGLERGLRLCISNTLLDDTCASIPGCTLE